MTSVLVPGWDQIPDKDQLEGGLVWTYIGGDIVYIAGKGWQREGEATL